MPIISMCPKPLSLEEQQRLYATKTYLLTHLDEVYSLRKLARMSLMGNRKFKDGFTELFGIAPIPFVREARMQMALFQLYHTDKAIKEIALSLGFTKTNNFSRAFKAFFTYSPSHVRNR